MLQSKNPRNESWKKLATFKQIKAAYKELFKSPERFAKFSHRFKINLVVVLKNRITDETMQLLLNLASEVISPTPSGKVRGRNQRTENRSVLHFLETVPIADTFRRTRRHDRGQPGAGQDEGLLGAPPFRATTGYTGKKITDIVNIASAVLTSDR